MDKIAIDRTGIEFQLEALARAEARLLDDKLKADLARTRQRLLGLLELALGQEREALPGL